MWNNAQSEVLKIEKELAQKGMSGEALYIRFHPPTPKNLRLASALRGAFLKDDVTDEQREQYFDYLRGHLQTTAELLIESSRVLALQELENRGMFDLEMTDKMLKHAIELNRQEIIVWLLQLKAEKYGFSDRDFSF